MIGFEVEHIIPVKHRDATQDSPGANLFGVALARVGFLAWRGGATPSTGTKEKRRGVSTPALV